MRNNNLLQQFKRWGLKSVVSVVIFISVVLLGGVIITLALPSSLDEVKSDRAHYQLSAENWDYVVEQVREQVNKLTTLSGKVATNITNIASLSGKLSTLSGTVSTLLGNSVRTKNGNNIYYSSGNVGIGINNPTVKLQVVGNIIANNPTATNHVATKGYVDSQISSIPTNEISITYYRAEYDNSGGCSYSKGKLKICESTSYARSDSRCANYCPTTTPRTYHNVPDADNRLTNMESSTFSPTIMANHDFCTLNGIGGKFEGAGENIFVSGQKGRRGILVDHQTSGGLYFSVVCVDFN